MKGRLSKFLLTVGFALTLIGQNALSAEKQKYVFMFFSNPVADREDDYLKWYTGQHIHDLLKIEGIVGAQFFKIADSQFIGTHPQKYMMIWEFETDDLAATFARVTNGLKTGTTVTNGTVDGATANSQTFTPITKRVTSEEIKGRSPEEVRMIATSGIK